MTAHRAALARRAVLNGFAFLFVCLMPPAVYAEPKQALAVSDFEFIDTSGEVLDQQDEHRTRLQAFMTALRADLERKQIQALISIEGGKGDAVAAAREAGARRVLVGGIHKMSTLVSWMKADVIDLETGEVIFDRLYTFRGDTDEAWRRAETFLAEQLESETSASH